MSEAADATTTLPQAPAEAAAAAPQDPAPQSPRVSGAPPGAGNPGGDAAPTAPGPAGPASSAPAGGEDAEKKVLGESAGRGALRRAGRAAAGTCGRSVASAAAAGKAPDGRRGRRGRRPAAPVPSAGGTSGSHVPSPRRALGLFPQRRKPGSEEERRPGRERGAGRGCGGGRDTRGTGTCSPRLGSAAGERELPLGKRKALDGEGWGRGRLRCLSRRPSHMGTGQTPCVRRPRAGQEVLQSCPGSLGLGPAVAPSLPTAAEDRSGCTSRFTLSPPGRRERPWLSRPQNVVGA